MVTCGDLAHRSAISLSRFTPAWQHNSTLLPHFQAAQMGRSITSKQHKRSLKGPASVDTQPKTNKTHRKEIALIYKPDSLTYTCLIRAVASSGRGPLSVRFVRPVERTSSGFFGSPMGAKKVPKRTWPAGTPQEDVRVREEDGRTRFVGGSETRVPGFCDRWWFSCVSTFFSREVGN